MIIRLLIQFLNILVAVLGLALMLRVILPWFGVAQNNPVLRFIMAITDPVVHPVRRIMGGSGTIWTGRGYLDLAPLATFFLLWLAQTVLVRVLWWIAAPPLWLLSPGDDLGRWLAGVLSLLFQLYSFVLLMRILLEWIRVPYSNPVMRFLWDATEPLLAPIRRRLPSFAGLDFSPILAMLLLSIAQTVLVALVQSIF